MLEEMKHFATQNALQQQLKNIQGNNASETVSSSPKMSRIAAHFDHTEKPPSTENLPSTPGKSKATVPKPNKFVQDMEERARQRAERKAELDRLKEQRQKEKMDAQRQKEEEERQREEAEKHKRMEEAREKKRIEREQEMEKQRKTEEAKRKLEMAEKHDERRLIKWYGVQPWQRCLEAGRRKNEMANDWRTRHLLKAHLHAWATHVRDANLERNRKVVVCRVHHLRRKCFAAWRLAKEESLRAEVKARQFWVVNLMRKVLGAWGAWTHEEKMAEWEKEKMATKHYEETLVKKVYFQGFKEVPVIARKERERESRKNQLRRKVADLLPDFSGS